MIGPIMIGLSTLITIGTTTSIAPIGTTTSMAPITISIRTTTKETITAPTIVMATIGGDCKISSQNSTLPLGKYDTINDYSIDNYQSLCME